MFRLLPCGPEPSGTPQALERPQGNWNHLERLERSSPLRGVRGVWNAHKATGTPQALEPCAAPLELREAHNFSAEREVDAGNRSCSAIRDFLCVRVLVV